MVDKRICEMRLDNRKATDIAQLIKKLIATHTTISTMESCTSGLIASMITDTEGASAIFPGGYVTYLNETKIFIGVDPKVLERYGVYSKECAEAMARSCIPTSRSGSPARPEILIRTMRTACREGYFSAF